MSRAPPKTSEWDVLKKHHKFKRADDEADDGTWEERLAKGYENKLFRELALIDLKHYKSKRFALRWRTATEVVDGKGDETCGSLRCQHHTPARLGDSTRHSRSPPRSTTPLRTFELPFVYQEDGERKETMVKVRLCRRCEAKLKWRPDDRDSASPTRREAKTEKRSAEHSSANAGRGDSKRRRG
ncbi:Protein FRA10AC1 [Vanrija pseudolonga]|uniref:Protein FRA10AC1 n=1 Tax=Vanrija pseudolonga TaxID=143232 RepID=A0AAF0YJD7_9TREE|nr:Protein FRA10AC1 [Vanrija pseudolonga]